MRFRADQTDNRHRRDDRGHDRQGPRTAPFQGRAPRNQRPSNPSKEDNEDIPASDENDQSGLSADDLAMIQDIVERLRRTKKDRKKEKPKILSLTSLTGKEPKSPDAPLSTKEVGHNDPPEPPRVTPDRALADEDPTIELLDEDSEDSDTTAILVVQLDLGDTPS